MERTTSNTQTIAGDDAPLILIAEDDKSTQTLLNGIIRGEGYRTLVVGDGLSAIRSIRDEIATVCLDLGLPGASGFECLSFLGKEFPNVPVIIISGSTKSNAARALKSGAFWFVEKPVNKSNLCTILAEAVLVWKTRKESKPIYSSLEEAFEHSLFSGTSQASRRLYEQLEKVISLTSNVMIVGEIGTGKSALADLLHDYGELRAHPLKRVNCELAKQETFLEAPIPKAETLRVSSSLFLDEVHQLSPRNQSILSGILDENSEFGDSQAPRLLSGTTARLDNFCEEHGFREDLYYAINTVTIQLAPLRERKQDLPLLADKILSKISQTRDVKPYQLTKDAMNLIQRHPWSGNFRELGSVLEEASALCSQNTIYLADLAFRPGNFREIAGSNSYQLAGLSMAEIERRAITETLAICNGNRGRASELLGISLRSIYNKIKKYNIIT